MAFLYNPFLTFLLRLRFPISLRSCGIYDPRRRARELTSVVSTGGETARRYHIFNAGTDWILKQVQNDNFQKSGDFRYT